MWNNASALSPSQSQTLHEAANSTSIDSAGNQCLKMTHWSCFLRVNTSCSRSGAPKDSRRNRHYPSACHRTCYSLAQLRNGEGSR